jgi:hypothetical protein
MEETNKDEAYAIATGIAKDIISGEISEYAGGLRICTEVIDRLGVKCPDDLWPFKSNTSAIEDIKWNAEQGGNKNEELIRQCEQEITVAAKYLTNKA